MTRMSRPKGQPMIHRPRALILSAALGAAIVRSGPAGAQSVPPAISAILPQDLSVRAMFQHADIVVQGVMIGLLFASVVTWTILIAKTIELAASVRAVRRSVAAAEEDRTLTGRRSRLGAERGAAGAFCEAAMAEMKLSVGSDPAGIKERIASRLHRLEAAFARRATRGHRAAGHDRVDLPLRGIVRHRLGHHEQLHRHFAVPHDQPGRGGARHRGSFVGDGDGVGGGDPGGGDLQCVRAGDRRLSCRARQPLGLVQRLASRELDMTRAMRAEAA